MEYVEGNDLSVLVKKNGPLSVDQAAHSAGGSRSGVSAQPGRDSLMAKLLAHHEVAIPALRKANAAVPEAVEAVFRKMVAKQRNARYLASDL